MDGATEAVEELAVLLKVRASQGRGTGSLAVPLTLVWYAVPPSTSWTGRQRQWRPWSCPSRPAPVKVVVTAAMVIFFWLRWPKKTVEAVTVFLEAMRYHVSIWMG